MVLYWFDNFCWCFTSVQLRLHGIDLLAYLRCASSNTWYLLLIIFMRFFGFSFLDLGFLDLLLCISYQLRLCLNCRPHLDK